MDNNTGPVTTGTEPVVGRITDAAGHVPMPEPLLAPLVAEPARVEVHNYPASIVQDVVDGAVRAWVALPAPEKALLRVAMRVTVLLALVRFLAVQSHNTVVTLGQDVLRDNGVQSALAALLGN